MAGKIRYFLEREGRYYARVVVPKNLRKHLNGRSELRTPLGADYGRACRVHAGALAALQSQIASAEQRAVSVGTLISARARYPLTAAQIARVSYEDRLVQDEHARNTNPHYAETLIDDVFAARLRFGMAGQLSDCDLEELVGHRITHFQRLGNTDAKVGSIEWRALARTICIAEYDALERIAERDEGVFDGQIKNALIAATPLPEEPLAPVLLEKLFMDYIATRKKIGRGNGAENRWASVFKSLAQFVKHGDARRLTKENIRSWRDDLLKTRSAKTVSDVHLAALRTVLSWAVREDRLAQNVAQDVRQDVPKRVSNRERGYTLDEATTLLKTTIAYEPLLNTKQGVTEYPETSAAKRWIPLLCAYSGARVTELTQLRKADLRLDGEIYVLRITPDAGTVKSGGYRDIPVHSHLVELGFPDFVASRAEGPLFYRSTPVKSNPSGAKTVAKRLGEWLNGIEVVPTGVSPSHGWRHRFKTVGRELGASDRVLDAICGHAGKTAGDDYGDVTVAAKAGVLSKFPRYKLSE